MSRWMKPSLCTTRRLVTSVSLVQRWNQARNGPVERDQRRDARQRQPEQIGAVGHRVRASARRRRSLRSRRGWPADRRSSGWWWNTAPFRRAAGFPRYSAPSSPRFHQLPAAGTRRKHRQNGPEPVAVSTPHRYVYAPFCTRAAGFCAVCSKSNITGDRGARHEPSRDEIRRNVRRQYRAHPQRRAACEA